MFSGLDIWKPVALAPLWQKVWSYQDELKLLQLMQSLIDGGWKIWESRSPDHWQDAQQQCRQTIENIQGLAPVRYTITDCPIYSILTAPDNVLPVESQRELMRTAVAIKQFQLKYSRLPSTLTELTPEFLDDAPWDYLGAQSLRYRPT